MIGIVLLSVSSIPIKYTLPSPWLAFAGLGLLALRTGGIKPCVSSFGGDQFNPAEVKRIARFFAIFYFTVNAGSVLSMLITPILRQDLHCFGMDSCFPIHCIWITFSVNANSIIDICCWKNTLSAHCN